MNQRQPSSSTLLFYLHSSNSEMDFAFTVKIQQMNFSRGWMRCLYEPPATETLRQGTTETKKLKRRSKEPPRQRNKETETQKMMPKGKKEPERPIKVNWRSVGETSEQS